MRFVIDWCPFCAEWGFIVREEDNVRCESCDDTMPLEAWSAYQAELREQGLPRRQELDR